MEKVLFEGVITSIQPRIRLLRSSGQDSCTYLGYAIIVSERATGKSLSIGVGVGTQQKLQLRVGMTISGSCFPVLEPYLESVDCYRASKLKKLTEEPIDLSSPPWKIVPPPIPVYRDRKPRKLSATTYEASCIPCIWGCKMAVEIVVDQKDYEKSEYRVETFCYGPEECKLYRRGSGDEE